MFQTKRFKTHSLFKHECINYLFYLMEQISQSDSEDKKIRIGVLLFSCLQILLYLMLLGNFNEQHDAVGM